MLPTVHKCTENENMHNIYRMSDEDQCPIAIYKSITNGLYNIRYNINIASTIYDLTIPLNVIGLLDKCQWIGKSSIKYLFVEDQLI